MGKPVRASTPIRARLYPEVGEEGRDCSGVSICLRDLTQRDADGISTWPRWRIRVDAMMPGGGIVHVGTVITECWRHAEDRAKARVVAVGSCPGAVNWEVDVRFYESEADANYTVLPDEWRADVELMASPCCPTPGLHAIPGQAHLAGDRYYTYGNTIAGGATVNIPITHPGESVLAFGAWQTGTGAFIQIIDYELDSVPVATYYLPPDGSVVLRPDRTLRAQALVFYDFQANVGGGAYFVETVR